MRALVAGAGIGGLTTGIALRRAGLEVTVLEQLEQVGTTIVGGGFHLWPNAIRALSELGLAEAVRDLGAPLGRTEFRNSTGGKLADWKIDELARSVDSFDVGIAREDLMSLLHRSFDGEIVAAAKVTDFEERGEAVSVRLADGREQSGDLLIGADGLRSLVRQQLLGRAEPDYAGYVQWQTLVEGVGHLFPEGIERITFGPGLRTVMHHVTGGRLFWACAIYGSEREGGRPPGRKAKLLERFGDWPEPIREAIEATPEEQITGLPVFDRQPVAAWGRGRVTLAGDAAHPMTTNTSQGGNQAIEDGVLLGRLLAAATDPAPALREYEQRRIARTTPLVKNSRWVSDLNAWNGGLKVRFRDAFFTVGLPRKGYKDLRVAVCTPL